jgi:hypothetical protein
VRVAPISRDADWLPAIEQFGEGIYVHFDEVAIGRWLANAVRPIKHDAFAGVAVTPPADGYP